MGLTGLFINRKGREGEGIVGEGEELKALKQELTTKLTGLMDDAVQRGGHPGGHRRLRAFLRARISTTARTSSSGYNAGYRTSWDCATGSVTTQVFEDNTKRWSGDHCIDPSLVPGIFFSNRSINGQRPDIRDIAPTVLALFGVPVPRFMRGAQLLKEKPMDGTKPQNGAGVGRRVKQAATQVTGALLLALGALLGPVIAPPSVDAGVSRVTSVAVGSPAHAIALDGQFAYVAHGHRPHHPRHLQSGRARRPRVDEDRRLRA